MGRILIDETGKYDFDIPAEVTNWTQNPQLALSSEDFIMRPGRTIRRFIVHTTLGIPALDIFDGPGAKGPRAENVASYWRRNKASASTPFIVDCDGSVVQCHYLGPVMAWHARGAAQDTIGGELVQIPGRGALYRAQFDTFGDIVAGFARSGFPFGKVLRDDGRTMEVRTSYPATGRPVPTVTGWRGVEGHCHCTPKDRSVNDPGMESLRGIARRIYDHGIEVREV